MINSVYDRVQEMMECKYCSNQQEPLLTNYRKTDNTNIDINNGYLRMFIDRSFNIGFKFDEKIKIRYCPMCGKKLNRVNAE